MPIPKSLNATNTSRMTPPTMTSKNMRSSIKFSNFDSTSALKLLIFMNQSIDFAKKKIGSDSLSLFFHGIR